MNTEYLLTIDDAAKALRCHRSFIYKLINQGVNRPGFPGGMFI